MEPECYKQLKGRDDLAIWKAYQHSDVAVRQGRKDSAKARFSGKCNGDSEE